jgi:uncharacterized protein (DUF2235 family)
MKRIVLCFDGTWNAPADDSIPENQRVETNVWRFFRSVDPTGPDGIEQDAWYNQGVGTSALNKLTGAAFGARLDVHILDGYSHLVDTYEPGDEIYVLGFSRGAYSARSLVGLIRNCGIVKKSFASKFQIGVAYGIYRTRDDGPDSETAVTFRKLFSREVEIHFLGVWDTVGALGIPLQAAQRLNAILYHFHDTELSKIVERAYHAIAVDEHREEYNVTLWTPKQKLDQILEQRWFSGAHGDVGGGYADRRLSDLTLRWMQDRATDASLGLKPISLGAENFKGPLTDSYAHFLGGLYALSHPRLYRPVCQTTFGSEIIDSSVDLRRRDAQLAYQPMNTGLRVLV